MYILFTSVPEDRDDAMLRLSDAGNLLLALIDNLSEVRFTYPGEDDSSITLYWNLEAADASLPDGENIKSYGQSPDKLAVLLAQITDSGTSSDTGQNEKTEQSTTDCTKKPFHNLTVAERFFIFF